MNLRDETKKLWKECFTDSDEFVEMFFSRVYRDDDLIYLTGEKGGNIQSAMLLQRYALSFHGQELPMAYVCGAATKRSQRGKGLMSLLMSRALVESYARGDAFSSLIPAHSWLYAFYQRFGFQSVFQVHLDHYTAFHPFVTEGDFGTAENLFSPEVYEAFRRLERKVPCRVLHSQRDFLNILDDINLDGGHVAVVTDRNAGGDIVAIALGVKRDEHVLVTDLLADSREAAVAALHNVREAFPEMPFTVPIMPVDDGLESRKKLTPKAMARIVNVGMVLSAIAAAHPKLRLALRVTDHIIPENNAIFLINRGTVAVNNAYPSKLDFDVDVETLTTLIFSSPEIGNITGLPSVRPQISLMLD